MRRLPALASLALLCSTASVFAQGTPPHERVRIVFDAGANVPLSSFAQSFSLTRNAESMPIKTDLKPAVAPVFGGGLRFRTSRSNSLGIVGFYGTGKAKGTVDAMVPHPFFFNQPREVTGSVSDLERRESGVHIEFVHTFDLSPSADLSLFGGPSFVAVQQDLVRDVIVTESYPYDTATLASTMSGTAKKSGAGFNIGGDMTWHISSGAGLALQVRYLYSSLDLPDSGNTTVTVHAGGLEAGIGLRLFLGRR